MTRSVEVLNEVTVDKREVPVTPAPRNAGINYNVKVENEKEQAVASIEKVEGETSEQWKQQQPEFFNEILEKVNGEYFSYQIKTPECIYLNFQY